MRIIDPCAGEGVALAECKHHLGSNNVEAYGVEFDRDRAWHAKTLLDKVIHGDFQETAISFRRFGLLWLNPPYGDLVGDQAATGDQEAKGRRRLEKLFYQRAHRLLQPGGVMVLIVPHYSLDKEFAAWVAGHFERVGCFMAPERRFKQAVVVGIRAHGWQFGDTAKAVRARLESLCAGEADTLPSQWDGIPYEIPEDKGQTVEFTAKRLDPSPACRGNPPPPLPVAAVWSAPGAGGEDATQAVARIVPLAPGPVAGGRPGLRGGPLQRRQPGLCRQGRHLQPSFRTPLCYNCAFPTELNDAVLRPS